MQTRPIPQENRGTGNVVYKLRITKKLRDQNDEKRQTRFKTKANAKKKANRKDTGKQINYDYFK